MSIIEQAIERMAHLKRAGVEIGEDGQAPAPAAEVAPAAPAPAPISAAPAPAPVAPAAVAVPDSVKPAAGENSRLVELDLARLDSMGLVVPSAPRSQIAEEFRVIKRPILANAHGKGAAPLQGAERPNPGSPTLGAVTVDEKNASWEFDRSSSPPSHGH